MSEPLRHLISLKNIDSGTITRLLDRAEALLQHGAAPDLLTGRTVLNLFFEPSTRTRTSFELAARRLGAWVVNFETAHASTSKGESLIDTMHTLEAMHIDALIVRHNKPDTPAYLSGHAQSAVSVINAGDGNRAHPTQGLLDVLTIRQQRPDFNRLTVTICGDIQHSRVARSDIHALAALGVGKLRVCGPPALMPANEQLPGCEFHENFDEAIDGADVVIVLRLQKERMHRALLLDNDDYFKHYGLGTDRLKRAAPDCLVLHPGPINRGIEIAPEIADGPQSMILRQVSNGIAVRMAVLTELLGA